MIFVASLFLLHQISRSQCWRIAYIGMLSRLLWRRAAAHRHGRALGAAFSSRHASSAGSASAVPRLSAPLCTGFALATTAAAGTTIAYCAVETAEASDGVPEAESATITNWSGTHTVTTDRYYTPESVDELKALVRQAHESGEPLRPVGSALSPNGLGLHAGGMVNLGLLDRVLWVDASRRLIRVEAGARVSQVVEALQPHRLTLENFASITEQQLGGFTQVGAHGTGITISPVDEQVMAMRLISPAAGDIELSASEDPDTDALFRLARTSLGALGVVAELTLKCVPAHRLVEQTQVLTRAQVRERHCQLLKQNRHTRYMWIPHVDAVVVVTANEYQGTDERRHEIEAQGQSRAASRDALRAAEELLLSHPRCKVAADTASAMSFTELRDELLRLDPLNAAWVARVNGAEAQFWRQSQGLRVDWSHRILQFDCGGQQWVSEVCFPASNAADSVADLSYVESVLQTIEHSQIPAPAPIEQRWSAASTSPLCAAGEKPTRELADLYSWVGIIMYLPKDDNSNGKVRDKVTHAFRRYKETCEQFWPRYRAVEHWAKIEMPHTEEERARLQLRMADKYPLDAFNAVRSLFDPRGILTSPLLRTLLDGGTMVKGDLMGAEEKA